MFLARQQGNVSRSVAMTFKLIHLRYALVTITVLSALAAIIGAAF